jgi:hypothetical protein
MKLLYGLIEYESDNMPPPAPFTFMHATYIFIKLNDTIIHDATYIFIKLNDTIIHDATMYH